MKDIICCNKKSGFSPKDDWEALTHVMQRNNMIKFSFKINQSSVHCWGGNAG